MMVQRLYLTIFLILGALVALDAQTFVTDVCGGNTFYDITSMTCVSCGSETSHRVPNNLTLSIYGQPMSCRCAAGYRSVSAACDLSSNLGCATPTCESCIAMNMASSRDGMQCLPCDSSTNGLDTIRGDCTCPAGYALNELSVTGEPLGYKECVKCPDGARVFPVSTGPRRGDLYKCQRCSDPVAIMQSTGECACPSGYHTLGTPYLQSGEVTCVLYAHADPVLSRFPAVAASTMSFYSIRSRVGENPNGQRLNFRSRYVEDAYMRAAVGCKAVASLVGSGVSSINPPLLGDGPSIGSAESCQTLANLCALHMYYVHSSPCEIFRSLSSARNAGVNGRADWPDSMPLLYWETTSARLKVDTTLQRTMEYKVGTREYSSASRRLRFYLAKFSLYGDFLGLEPLTGQFSYCGSPSAGGDSDKATWSFFGHNKVHEFQCDLRVLSQMSETYFYDLYVRDLARSPLDDDIDAEVLGLAKIPQYLQPVPVRVENLRDASGNTPNVNSKFSDELNDVYTGRFFLFDPISGSPEGRDTLTTVHPALRSAEFSTHEKPEIIRFASRITLTVTTQPDHEDKITTPILSIRYEERLVNMVEKGVNHGLAFGTVVFRTEYTGEYSSYQSTILALGAAVVVLLVLWASLKTSIWTRSNIRSNATVEVSLEMVARWGLFVVSGAGVAIFWYLFIVTSYWLVYFKLQDSVYELLPLDRSWLSYGDNAYNILTAAIWVLFVVISVRIVYFLHRQCTLDMFFVDWEAPAPGNVLMDSAAVEAAHRANAASTEYQKGKWAQPSGTNGARNLVLGAEDRRQIPAWRRIFAANEWASLSTERRISLPLTLVILVLLLEGARLKNVATPQPIIADLSDGEHNPILRFANAAFWFLLIACAQILLRFLIYERFIVENPTARFIDMCSVMKVSLLLIDEKFHGYYLHANAPYARTDCPMAEISAHLNEEARVARIGRGIPGSPDPLCQTFELHFARSWGETFDKIHERDFSDFARARVGVSSFNDVSEGAARLIGVRGGQKKLRTALVNRLDKFGISGTGPRSSAYTSSTDSNIQTPIDPDGAPLALQRAFNRQPTGNFDLTTFLVNFFNDSCVDQKRFWGERTLMQAAFDIPPDMKEVSDSKVEYGISKIYLDHRYRFESTIFRGIEFDLLIFDISLFCLVLHYTDSPTAAAVVTFIIASFLKFVRRLFGDRNIAQKALIDDRFFAF